MCPCVGMCRCVQRPEVFESLEPESQVDESHLT